MAGSIDSSISKACEQFPLQPLPAREMRALACQMARLSLALLGQSRLPKAESPAPGMQRKHIWPTKRAGTCVCACVCVCVFV